MKNKSKKEGRVSKKVKGFDMYETRETPQAEERKKREKRYEENRPLHAKLILLATETEHKTKKFTEVFDKNSIKLLPKTEVRNG